VFVSEQPKARSEQGNSPRALSWPTIEDPAAETLSKLTGQQQSFVIVG
jgi:hypothetical protein